MPKTFRTVFATTILLLALPVHALDATSAVTVTPLLKTTSTWDGQPIVYPEGQGEVTAFIIDGFLATGRIEAVLAEFPVPELGIYAMLPSNRHVPHRVRVLMDALAAGLVV